MWPRTGLAFERGCAQIEDAPSCFLEVASCQIHRAGDRRFQTVRIRSGVDPGVEGVELQEDGREALAQRVVEFAGETIAFFDGAEFGALFIEPSALDGDAHKVGDGVEQLEILLRELAPFGAPDVQDTELLLFRVDGDAGVILEAGCSFQQPCQSTARDDVDVRRTLEIPLRVRIEAVAVALHPLGVLRECGRQVL